MATNITPTVYPKDLTMSLDSNHIRNEIRDFADDNERIFVPNGGPFYSQSMQIQTRDGRPLRPITEYQILYLNEDATLESNRNVCAVIRILNKSITSVVLDYRVIGGEYSNTVYGIKQDLLRGGKNDHILDWNINVYNKPSEYPVGPHFHRGEDFTDWDAVWVQLEGIRKAIIHGDSASWQSVYDYIDAKMSRDIAGISNDYSTAIQQALDSTLVNYTLKTEVNAFKATVYTKTQVDGLINTVNNKINTDVLAAKTEAINKATEAKTAADAAKRAADTALANAATADSKAVAADAKAVANTTEINKLKTKDTAIDSEIAKLKTKDTSIDSEIAKLKTKDTAIDSEIAKLKQADTTMQTSIANATGKVSKETGNLLEMRNDGIFYSIKKPPEAIPVGGLFITTKEYTNSTQIRADLGYGRWERYAKGMTLVGVDPAVRSSKGNHVLSFWQKIGNTFGSYVNVLNTGNLPLHGHRVFNTWPGDNPPEREMWEAFQNNGGSHANDSVWDVHGFQATSRMGSGLPINNVQPSITVGIWVRLPDATGNDPVIPTAYNNNVPDFAKSEMELINDTDIRNIKLSLDRHDLHIRTNRNITVGGFAYVGKPSVNNTTDLNRVFIYLNNQQVGSQRIQNRVVQPASEYARQGTGTVTGSITGHEYNEFGKTIDYDLPAATTPNNNLSALPANYRNALNAAKAASAQIVDLGSGKRGYLMGTQVISQAHTGSVPYNGDSTRQVATFRSTVVNSWVSNIASTYGFTGYPTAAKEFTSMLNHNASGEASGSVVFHEMSAEVPYTDNPWAVHIVSRVQKGFISITSGVIPNKVAFKEDYFYRRTIANNAGLNAPNHDVITWHLVIPTGFAT